MSEPVGTIDFPPDWVNGRTWAVGPEILFAGTLEATGDHAIAAGGVLYGGDNLIGLCFPTGQRLARVRPETDWALEERFDGCEPRDGATVLRSLWASVVEAMIFGVKAARAEGEL